MLGSAQLLFEDDGTSLLYTGDIKLRQAGGALPTFVPRADVLIVETTYGRPHFRFGDPDSTVESIAMWGRRALDGNVTPVLLCHALGKTEEMMLALAPYGFAFALEKRCVPCAREYATAGRPLPEWVELDGQAESGRVVIAPPAGKDEVRRLGRYRTALVSGWAKDAEFARIFGADATFDLSDHCDCDGLIDGVQRVRVLGLEGGTKAPPGDVEHQLGDRAAVQVAALDLGCWDPLDQVVEKLCRVLLPAHRRVAENASAFEGHRRCRADRAVRHVSGAPRSAAYFAASAAGGKGATSTRGSASRGCVTERAQESTPASAPTGVSAKSEISLGGLAPGRLGRA